ncbi:hypothetical protein [Hoeflea prorocentri]|uniref:Uncharacterized protein n=1 Tax=Hoeflea prorocentri TaxID=1922333 RepID=A0A9X3UK85_9HYPH|nr:hypothetical protein [Hoeflea prorocentri]MCY6382862.1 hypothetical protein [Hoeflea prorocentri]MDA5400662.1 hypothetical protein [Hoeflea prorocentri]
MPKNVIKADEIDCHEPEPVLSGFRSLHTLAASRGDGLHPKLLALAERTANGALGHPTRQLGCDLSGTFLDPDRFAADTASKTGAATMRHDLVRGEKD